MQQVLKSKKAIITDFLQKVWSEGNVDAVDDYLADHYSISHDPGDPWDGHTLTVSKFKERLVQSRAMAPDQVFTVEKMIEDEDNVVVGWTWKGTHLGDIPGIPATGRKTTMSGLTIYEFQNFRLCGHWQIADRLSVYQQLAKQ